jgi:hypothetical protein
VRANKCDKDEGKYRAAKDKTGKTQLLADLQFQTCKSTAKNSKKNVEV